MGSSPLRRGEDGSSGVYRRKVAGRVSRSSRLIPSMILKELLSRTVMDVEAGGVFKATTRYRGHHEPPALKSSSLLHPATSCLPTCVSSASQHRDMPSRGSRAWKARTTPTAQPASARPRLTQEQLQALAKKMQESYKWDTEPKDFQLSAVQAQIEGVDMIVQAPTGSGKTAIAAGPHLWPGNENKFTLMICPLLSLEEEMVRNHILRRSPYYSLP